MNDPGSPFQNPPSVVVMGVAGCGKSSLGAALAEALQRPLIEGDDFHSVTSRDKMSRGIALTDDDRAGWLDALAGQLGEHPGAVLTCSALKRSYRDRLRAATAGLRFVFIDLPPEVALERVAQRRQRHFFSTALVDSQFRTLELPTGEPGVLRVDGCAALSELQQQAAAWLRAAGEA